jgi:hypothetical protein
VVWEAGCGRLWFKVGMNNGTCLRTLLLERSKLYILMFTALWLKGFVPARLGETFCDDDDDDDDSPF